MIKKLLTTPLLYIFILALFLRLWQLNILPPGFHVDEVKIGWNAYSLWQTGRDDWLHPFPLHYDTFGDQRPTGIFYATVPSLGLFGLDVFAVRFPSALFGALAVIAVFYFCKALSLNHSISYLSSFLLAISPWHINVSRASSEGIIAVTLVLFGLVFLLKSLTKKSFNYLLVAALFLAFSYFFYHSARLLVPIFVFSVVLLHSLKNNIWIPGWCLFVLTGLFTLVFALTPAARSRLAQVSIFNDQETKFELQRLPFEEGPNHILLTRALHNKLVEYVSRFLNEYTKYVSSRFFLTPGEAKPVRYETASRGLLLYTEFFLLGLGLFAFAKGKYSFLPIALILLAPLPAAVTTEDAPNLHRALFMSPFVSIIAAFGLHFLITNYKKFSYLVFFILSLDFVHYAHMYVVHNPMREEITLSRNTGTVELINRVLAEKNNYSHILLSNRPDNLYPWYAFLTKADPRVFNPVIAPNKNSEFIVDNLTFSQYRCPSEQISKNPPSATLGVDTEGCPIYGNLKKTDMIQRTSGGYPFTLWTYPHAK